MICALIFDCFGVMYLDPGLGFYEQAIPNFKTLKSEIFDLDRQYDYGLIDASEHAQAIADLSGLQYEYVRDNVRGTHVRNDALVEYSQSIRSDYKVGMLSNIGTGGMQAFFTTDEQTRLFDAVVLSSEVGLIKPSVAIFEHTAEKLEVNTNDCIMIDDRQDNIEGAQLAGMQTVLYSDTQQCINDIHRILEAEHA